MGLKNFTGTDDDNNGGPGGPDDLAGLGLFAIPSGSPGGPGAPDDNNDVTSLLINYNEKFKTAEPTLFRDGLIEQLLSVLISKNKPNALLVGPAGVGKTKIVEDVARRIAIGDTLIPDQLSDRVIYELPIASILATGGIVGGIERTMQALVEFASDPDNKAIIFIDEVHQITGSTSSGNGDMSARKISQILKPALARGGMSLIGATTGTESDAFDDDPAFARRFTRLLVDELEADQTRVILNTVRPGLVAHYRHQISVDDAVLEATVEIAEEFSRAGQHRPDNAITLLDRAMADRVLEQKRLIRAAEDAGDTNLVNILRSIPTVPLTLHRLQDVAKRLMTGNAVARELDVALLSADLRTRLQGQDEVIDQLVDRLARAQLELFPSKTPMTWMFAGASGVGKTETAKIVAQHLTDAEPIILNMTEFHTSADTAKIIGAPPGYLGSDSKKELPFDTLESNPHRVILLDEFEKADKAVQRLFLSAFDEGYIRNAAGKMLDFSKALVIVTTNAARESLSGTSIGFGSGPVRTSNRSLNKALSEFFDTELLGRFSLIVGFNAIDEKTFRSIMTAHYASQRDAIRQTKPRLGALLPDAIDDATLRSLSETSYIDTQGARPARKAIQTWIEDHLIAAKRALGRSGTIPGAQHGATDAGVDAPTGQDLD